MEATAENIGRLEGLLLNHEVTLRKNPESKLYSFLVSNLRCTIDALRSRLLDGPIDGRDHKAYVFMASDGEYDAYHEYITAVVLVPRDTPSIGELKKEFAEWMKKDQAWLAEEFAKDGVITLKSNGRPTSAFMSRLRQVQMTGRYDFASWVARRYYGKIVKYESIVE